MVPDGSITVRLRSRECRRCGKRCGAATPPGTIEVTVHRKRRQPTFVYVDYGAGVVLSDIGQARAAELLTVYHLSGWLVNGVQVKPSRVHFDLGPCSGHVPLDAIVDTVTEDLLKLARHHSVLVPDGREARRRG